MWFRWVAGSAQPGAVGGRNLRITLWLVGQPAASGWAVPRTDDPEHDASETQMSVRILVKDFRATRKGFLVLTSRLERFPRNKTPRVVPLNRSSRREEARFSKSEIRNPKSEIDRSLLTSAATKFIVHGEHG